MKTNYTHHTSILRLIAGAAAVAFAAASYAATTITDYLSVSGDSADNYIFAGDGGVSYLITPMNSGQVRNLKMVGSAYVGTMEVNSGVDAIINFTTTERGGYSSGGNVGFRFGGSINTVNGSATLSGAGKDVSSLSFTVFVLTPATLIPPRRQAGRRTL